MKITSGRRRETSSSRAVGEIGLLVVAHAEFGAGRGGDGGVAGATLRADPCLAGPEAGDRSSQHHGQELSKCPTITGGTQ